MVKESLLFIILICFIKIGYSQDKFTLSGNVTDATNGENLIGATVVVNSEKSAGTITNGYGFYSITLLKGNYSITFRFIGYESKTYDIELSENKKLDIELAETFFRIGNVEIKGEKADKNITSTEMGSIKVSPKQIENIPVLFGERDILKTIQLTPGITAAGEGNTGYSVRGGGLDQNLILLDEAPVYNSSHLMGFFSVFNSEAIKDATLWKGSIPAEYGGRASSVMDIKMKDGNLKNYGVSGSLGLISSNVALEGPIAKNKASFIASARRTYADIFLGLTNNEDLKNSKLYFYDFNLKTNWKLNDNNRLYLSGYFGRDNFEFSSRFGFAWGSTTGTLRWNHIYNEKLFSNTSLIYSNYSYEINIFRSMDVSIRSEIHDWNLKQDFSYYLNDKNTIKFGGNIIKHTILPGKVKAANTTIFDEFNIKERKAVESALYISNNQKISDRLIASYGLRLALFSNVGPGDFYEFDENGELVNTKTYDQFEWVKTQGGLEPRLGINYILTKQSSLKASYNRIYQFLHLLSNSTTINPTDVWLPSSDNVRPQIADQLSLGYFRNLKNNRFETSVEVYYKNLQNQIDYKNGANLVYNSTVESELVFGKGWAYGAEFYLKKNYGNLTGWLSYTLSRTMKKFEDINDGKPFPARYDRLHDVSIVGQYKFTQNLSFSATWVFNTGNAVTFPSGRYEIDGQLVGYYTERNGYRMPDYHRLDLGIIWIRKKTEKYESSWIFSVYNAYGRENAYYIDFREKEGEPNVTEAVQVSLFKAVPSVSYKFKF